jgi:hypothetical protein
MKLPRTMRGLASVAALAFLVLCAGRARAGVSVDDLCRAVVEDPSYKVRVSAALTLGKVGGTAAVPALIKALADQNNSVRGIAAQSLGRIGDSSASEPLRDLLRREADGFVKSQATTALAVLSGGGNKHAKIYLVFGPFTGGVKSAGPEASKIIADAFQSRRSAQLRQDGDAGVLHRRQHHPARGRGRRWGVGDQLRRQGDGGALADEKHHQLDQRGRQPAVGLAAARQGERAARLPGGLGGTAGRRPGTFFQVARRIDKMSEQRTMWIGRVS